MATVVQIVTVSISVAIVYHDWCFLAFYGCCCHVFLWFSVFTSLFVSLSISLRLHICLFAIVSVVSLFLHILMKKHNNILCNSYYCYCIAILKYYYSCFFVACNKSTIVFCAIYFIIKNCIINNHYDYLLKAQLYSVQFNLLAIIIFILLHCIKSTMLFCAIDAININFNCCIVLNWKAQCNSVQFVKLNYYYLFSYWFEKHNVILCNSQIIFI